MATNPYVNKVVYGNNTLIDLTEDTVSPEYVIQGEIFHDATGEQKVGTLVQGWPYKKNGVLTDFSSINEEKIIETGLSSIAFFYLEGTPQNVATVVHKTWLDRSELHSTRAKQVCTQAALNGATVSGTGSGSDADGFITANSIYLKITNISGGRVTVKTGNNVSYIHKNIIWYAG